MNNITKWNSFEVYREYRGYELPKLRKLAERAKYEHNCKVELNNNCIIVRAKMPLDCDETVKYQVEYSNNTIRDLNKALALVDECFRNIYKPLFMGLILTVKGSLPYYELICQDHDVVLKALNREPVSFGYNQNDFERCIETIGTLIVDASSFGQHPTQICKSNTRKKTNWRKANSSKGKRRRKNKAKRQGGRR